MMHKNLKSHRILFSILVIAVSACCSIGGKKDQLQAPYLKTQIEQYIQDVAIISTMPRVTGGSHHKAIQKICADRFDKLGFQVELHNYGTGLNVIGTLPGKQKPTEKIIVSAHYDTVPNCNGADDNASGIAGLFATAKVLASKQHNRTLVVACWDEEEKNTIGSIAYVKREQNHNADIKISYVYEMIGYKSNESNSQQTPEGFKLLYPQQIRSIQHNQNRGDFIALVYDEQASAFLSDITEVAKKNKLSVMQFEVNSTMKRSPLITDLRRSDHSSFWDADYPAVMITDTANFRNQNYHCLNGDDNAESLDVDFALKTINTISVIIEKNLK